MHYLQMAILNLPHPYLKNKGEKFLKETSFQIMHWTYKKNRNKAGMRNSRTPPTTEWWRPPLWPPTQCTCIPSSLCQGRRHGCGWYSHGRTSFYLKKMADDIHIHLVYRQCGRQHFVSASCPPGVHAITKRNSRTMYTWFPLVSSLHRLNF